MAQGEFTKQECRLIREAYADLLNALPKSKKFNFIGDANDMFLFLAAAEAAAPDKPDPTATAAQPA